MFYFIILIVAGNKLRGLIEWAHKPPFLMACYNYLIKKSIFRTLSRLTLNVQNSFMKILFIQILFSEKKSWILL